MKLFRVIVPVSDIEHASRWYASVLGIEGVRVSEGREYFQVGETILACFDAVREDGMHPDDWRSSPEHLYLSVDSLEEVHRRAGAPGPIEEQPWGERSFYMRDPFGNPLCFVQAGTEFTGWG